MSKELEFIKKMGLEEEFEEFKEIPILEIKFDNTDWLYLYKNGNKCATLSVSKYFNIDEFKDIVYTIADIMNCLSIKEQILNKNKYNYQVYYSIQSKLWYTNKTINGIDSSSIIDTIENAQKIADILNNSKDMKEWMNGSR